ncbi:MAG: hypothetical protein LCH26_01620 [Proteobacteria bacterium]|nr:hypothetical protein [Pseudomonadota bacterium]
MRHIRSFLLAITLFAFLVHTPCDAYTDDLSTEHESRTTSGYAVTLPYAGDIEVGKDFIEILRYLVALKKTHNSLHTLVTEAMRESLSARHREILNRNYQRDVAQAPAEWRLRTTDILTIRNATTSLEYLQWILIELP